MEIKNFFVDGDTDEQKTSKAQKVWNKIKKATPIEFNSIKLGKGKTSLLQSKICGNPYIPKGFNYPMTSTPSCEIKPMRLLAQINFEEMPHIENFPEKGILQFFIACQEDDDLYGCDLDDQIVKSGFQVIFHSEPSESKAIDCTYEFPENVFPAEFEAKMEFSKKIEALTMRDYRFEEMFLRGYNKFDGEPLTDVFDLPDEIYNRMVDESSGIGHKIGGYPFFTQDDPREFDNEYSKHNVLLFQLDTDEENGIMWGDCGVANFFITFEDLKNRDFSKVMYNWDCC